MFTVSEGFIRTSLEQDVDALRAAQDSGPYAGVRADDLAGENLTPLFMIENTVRVADLPDPDNPPDPGPDPDPEPTPEPDPGTEPDESEHPDRALHTLQPIPFPNTGDRMGGALLVLAVLIVLAALALIADRVMMRMMWKGAFFSGKPSGAHVRVKERPDKPHFHT